MLAGTYWSPDIRREIVAKALRNSITAVAIDHATGATIGLARVVTDRATFAWQCDVFVIQPFRRELAGFHRRLHSPRIQSRSARAAVLPPETANEHTERTILTMTRGPGSTRTPRP